MLVGERKRPRCRCGRTDSRVHPHLFDCAHIAAPAGDDRTREETKKLIIFSHADNTFVIDVEHNERGERKP